MLRDVTFGYGRATEPVIDGLDLAIAEGEHLAVVGPSGVGKSTLAGLIAGLLEPQQGEVTARRRRRSPRSIRGRPRGTAR